MAVRAVARGALDGRRDGGDGRLPALGLDHELEALAAAQAEQRRRAEHLRAGARARRSARRRPAPAAARAAAPSSARKTIRIRSENGG